MSKTIRLNTTHYSVSIMPSKRKLQQIASNHLPDNEFKYFIRFCKDFTKELYSVLVNDTNLLIYHQIIH